MELLISRFSLLQFPFPLKIELNFIFFTFLIIKIFTEFSIAVGKI